MTFLFLFLLLCLYLVLYAFLATKKKLDLPTKSTKNDSEQDRSTIEWPWHVGSDDPTTQHSFLATLLLETHQGQEKSQVI